jgi:integrase
VASISRGPNGRRTIQFTGPDGRRKTLRLGKCSQRAAESVKAKVEALVAADLARVAVDNETARWLGEVGAELHGKLVAVGLVKARLEPAPVLKDFLDAFIAGRTDFKPNTVRNCRTEANALVAYFGPDRRLRDIVPGDVDDFIVWLKAQGLANATLGRRLKRCKQFFRAALRKKMIAENPFADVKPPAQTNEARKFFVTADATEKLLAACPDAQWRLIVALSRFGGLRCPSETMALTWGDVDWERGRVRVRSPKTEHLTGGASREIPLFPELRPFLEAAFDDAEPGTVHVVTRYRDADQNLRTQLLRIIRRAGLTAWPKPFHNLRVTRETELAEVYPTHVVCKWIGNTERIAAKQYLQVTDGHFERATEGAAKSDARALQNPTLPTADRKGQQSPETTKAPVSQGFCQPLSSKVLCCQDLGVPPRGVEPLSSG